MISILGLLNQIVNLLTKIYQQNVQILKGQEKEKADIEALAVQQTELLAAVQELQSDVDVIKKVLGIGVPVTETIVFGSPKP